MPLVYVVDEHHAQKEEDDGVARGAQHLDEVFDRCERLVRYVGERIMRLHQTTTYRANRVKQKKKLFNITLDQMLVKNSSNNLISFNVYTRIKYCVKIKSKTIGLLKAIRDES